MLQQLGTSSAKTTCRQLVNRLVTTCLQTCNNLCVFTCVEHVWSSTFFRVVLDFSRGGGGARHQLGRTHSSMVAPPCNPQRPPARFPFQTAGSHLNDAILRRFTSDLSRQSIFILTACFPKNSALFQQELFEFQPKLCQGTMDIVGFVWAPDSTHGFRLGRVVDLGADTISVEPLDSRGSVCYCFSCSFKTS